MIVNSKTVQYLVVGNQKYEKHKTEHQEEPEVLDTINTIAFSKINNEVKLTFVLVYREYSMFAGIIHICVIIFNNKVVLSRCIR